MNKEEFEELKAQIAQKQSHVNSSKSQTQSCKRCYRIFMSLMLIGTIGVFGWGYQRITKSSLYEELHTFVVSNTLEIEMDTTTNTTQTTIEPNMTE
jgi:hypothetical protein